MANQEVIYTLILILLSIIGFFLRSLVRTVDNLNSTLIKHVERVEFQSSEIRDNKKSIDLLRERCHQNVTELNKIYITIEKLKKN